MMDFIIITLVLLKLLTRNRGNFYQCKNANTGFMLFFASPGDMCLGPQVTSQTYTTPETTVSTETVFIVEFSVTCKNGLKVRLDSD